MTADDSSDTGIGVSTQSDGAEMESETDKEGKDPQGQWNSGETSPCNGAVKCDLTRLTGGDGTNQSQNETTCGNGQVSRGKKWFDNLDAAVYNVRNCTLLQTR